MAEHLQRREHMRQLIDRRGGEARPRPQRAVQERRGEQRRVGVHGGIAQIDAHRTAAVPALDGGDPLAGLLQRRLPGDRLPPATLSPLRLEEAVGIGLHVADGGGLGTDVAAAEGIALVSPDARDRAAVELD